MSHGEETADSSYSPPLFVSHASAPQARIIPSSPCRSVFNLSNFLHFSVREQPRDRERARMKRPSSGFCGRLLTIALLSGTQMIVLLRSPDLVYDVAGERNEVLTVLKGPRLSRLGAFPCHGIARSR